MNEYAIKRNVKPQKKGTRPELPGGATSAQAPKQPALDAVEPASYPIYILDLDSTIQIVFPDNREDLPHPDFWEQTVCHLVARHFGIPSRRLANLPYCQRRARIVGNKVYYGETHDPDLLRLIREALANSELVFCYDDHEKRLGGDVRQLERLVRQRRAR